MLQYNSTWSLRSTVSKLFFTAPAYGRKILLANNSDPNIVGCYIWRPFAHPVACCWMSGADPGSFLAGGAGRKFQFPVSL